MDPVKSALAMVFATLFLVSSVSPLAAQTAAARVVNPEGFEFQLSPLYDQTATAYRVELFLSGSDISVTPPVRTLDVPAAGREPGQTIRIDFRAVLNGVADGEYIATIRQVDAAGTSPRSLPTEAFIVSGHGAARTGLPSAPTLTDEEKRHERYWTRVAIVVGAAIVALPFVLR
jgi:hypothetical protein